MTKKKIAQAYFRSYAHFLVFRISDLASAVVNIAIFYGQCHNYK